MSSTVLSAMVLFCVLAGVLAVRLLSLMKRRKLVARRIQEALGEEAEPELNLLKRSEAELSKLNGHAILSKVAAPTWLTSTLEQSGLGLEIGDFLLLTTACGLVPGLLLYLFNLGELPAIVGGLTFAMAPAGVVAYLAARRRNKFVEQLPDAIDLMVSVLRSGHSVPQAVRSVAREAAEPLGKEFAQVMQRMNLGQPFSESLAQSVSRYRSEELDLIRRAVSIQAEVGGSLAELLDKTNLTLRQRIKLKRQVLVLTSQSRLTGLIVGFLPILLAVALEVLNPGYLNPLFTSDMGRLLLGGAFGLEILGLFIMKKMTEVKV